MTLDDVLSIVDGRLVTQGVDLACDIQMACGADLMSDVLAFTHSGTLLLTGLINPQVVRTAEMAGVCAIVFVRGKVPPADTFSWRKEKEIPLLRPFTLTKRAGGSIRLVCPVVASLTWGPTRGALPLTAAPSSRAHPRSTVRAASDGLRPNVGRDCVR